MAFRRGIGDAPLPASLTFSHALQVMRPGDEVVVGEATALNLLHRPNEPLSVVVLALVEAEGLFVQIPEQVEWLHAHVGATDGPLEQRPEVFHPVRVDLALGVALGVIDDVVRVIRAQVVVAFQIVGVDARAVLDLIDDPRHEFLALGAWHDGRSHPGLALAWVTLQEAHHGHLAGPGVII